MVHLNLEVTRLSMAMNVKGVFPMLMSRKQKLEFLAEGVIDGWYGRDYMAKRILKNLYSEVQEKVVELSKQKHTL